MNNSLEEMIDADSNSTNSTILITEHDIEDNFVLVKAYRVILRNITFNNRIIFLSGDS